MGRLLHLETFPCRGRGDDPSRAKDGQTELLVVAACTSSSSPGGFGQDTKRPLFRMLKPHRGTLKQVSTDAVHHPTGMYVTLLPQ